MSTGSSTIQGSRVRPRVLLIGEVILDITVPIAPPDRVRSALRRSEPIVYEQLREEKVVLGGMLYIGRFLRHFAAVRAIVPVSTSGLHLRSAREKLDDLRQRGEVRGGSIEITEIELPRQLYSATRFVEIGEQEVLEDVFPPGKGLLRIDSGSSYPVSPDEAKHVLEKVKDALATWRWQGGDSFVLLADYDLGLFSHRFIRDLAKCLPREVPVVVYAGASWRKFARCLNCWVVADTREAIAELVGFDGADDESVIKADPFSVISERYPNLRGFVLSDVKETRIAVWKKLSVGGLVGEEYVLSTGYTSARTPAGHRALLASYLCVDPPEPIDNWLPKAHEAARHCEAVLIDKFERSSHNENLGLFPTEVATRSFEVPAARLFWAELWEAGLELRLADARTELEDIITRDPRLRADLRDIVERVKQGNLPQSLFASDCRCYVRKLLIVGEPGSGKTFVAFQLGALRSSRKPKKVQCNEDQVSDAHQAVESICSTIVAKGNDVIILDEVDKFPGVSRDIQSRLLPRFDSAEGAPVRHKLVILTASKSVKDLLDDPQQLPDFYSRFPAVLEVPPVRERPLDSPYILGARLLKKNIYRVSLEGIVAVAGKLFNDTRAIGDLADLICSNVNGSEVGWEVFEAAGLRPSGVVREDHFVTIVP